MKFALIFVALIVYSLSIRVTIDEFGAVRNKDFLGAHLVNQEALYAAIKAVNASTDYVK